MNIIKFNNTEFEVESYNKNTYFSSDSIMSNASCSINTSDFSALAALARTPITFISITADNEVIYTLNNIHGRIDSINEYLNGNRMSISMALSFLDNSIEESNT